MPRCGYKRRFIFTLPCMNRKSRLFRKTKMFPFAENLSKCIRKPLISARQTSSFLRKPFFSVLKRRPFLQTKSFSFVQAFPYCHPKQPFSALSFPFAPSHNLLFVKNTAILLSSALNPYAVTPEPRTDSKPFRRRFVRKTGFGSCCREFFQDYFRQSFESRSQDGVPRAFWLLFARRKK